jgi:hypothetical protein
MVVAAAAVSSPSGLFVGSGDISYQARCCFGGGSPRCRLDTVLWYEAAKLISRVRVSEHSGVGMV